jgi:hypothetical protein
MPDAARCERTDLLVAECSHCRGLDELPLDPELDWFEARLPGRCAYDPRHAIDPGDQIARTENGYICKRRHDA